MFFLLSRKNTHPCTPAGCVKVNGGALQLSCNKLITCCNLNAYAPRRCYVLWLQQRQNEKGGDEMNAKRITLLLPESIIEAAERSAAARETTRHNFLVDLIISNMGTAAEDKTAEKIREIADLQRVSISIMARIWGERNPEASRIIRDMMTQQAKR